MCNAIWSASRKGCNEYSPGCQSGDSASSILHGKEKMKKCFEALINQRAFLWPNNVILRENINKSVMKLIFASLILLFMADISFSQSLKINDKDLKMLAGMMAGDFSSEEQARVDADYIHIILNMTPILKESTDGYWLYVEQAMASTADKPYRQRVYHLYLQDDTTIVSKVYELKNPQQYTGGGKDDTKLAPVTADSLIDRLGCSIYLHKTGKKTFRGSTPGKECLSTLRGAAYATSEVVISPGKMESWDRGWNREDQQVWGAEKGGYVFLKK
jgi:CpeT protein